MSTAYPLVDCHAVEHGAQPNCVINFPLQS
ncbi:hypothetical protein SAMN04490183_1817 [Pseudomonas corrugata]|nr:hypothetical protein SAMN04490183_1817 [Pseudomonas corrugata]